jgi:hypothetical protein
MSRIESRRKARNRARLAGFFSENMPLSERRMTAAAFARRADTTDRSPQTGSIVVASRIVRGKASGRISQTSIDQTSIQERYS